MKLLVVMGLWLACLAVGSAGLWAAGPPIRGAAVVVANTILVGDLGEEEIAARIVGPERTENNCASCHALEHETWQHTRHYATFKDRHRSERAGEILKNMGQRSMKRSASCRQCHYTSVLKGKKLRANWGVSCESCHSPARDWVNVHQKVGGDLSAPALNWGAGKDETPDQKSARRRPAVDAGMIHSDMIYHIARNCFGCHTVPDEVLVNKGNHKAGSDFDLVVWSQGEIRHNFASSAGAPDNPTNRPAAPDQRRRLYVVGAMTDLEVSLRNLAGVKEQGRAFHIAMVDRTNRARATIDAILAVVKIAELAEAVKQVPDRIDVSTLIRADQADALSMASKQFVEQYDGSTLGAIDGQIPVEVKGTPYKE